MYSEVNGIIMALAMVAAAVVLYFAWRAWLHAGSERRMRAMLEAVGLRPDLASSGHVAAIMHEVRQRCRACSSEDVCERWLREGKAGEPDFCPNARVFEMLGEHRARRRQATG